MAGFRGPLLPLALSAVVTVQAGYRSPLPVPPLSGQPAGVQAGFRSPLPVPPLSGQSAGAQAGYRGPLPIPPISGDTAIVEPPERGRNKGTERPPDEYRPSDDDILLLFAATVIQEIARK